jgi:hypothetical protein
MAQLVKDDLIKKVNTQIDRGGKNLVTKRVLNDLLKDFADSFVNKKTNT